MVDARESGIDALGAVPWGTHLCQFYHTRRDLFDVLVPYFKAGLENNESCIWVTSDSLTEKEADETLRKAIPDFHRYRVRNQIEIIPHTDWYLKGGTFNGKRVMDAWDDRIERALASGYDGLRVSADTAWLERKDWDEFISYGEAGNNTRGRHNMLAICTYPLHKYSASEIINVERSHHYHLIKEKGELVVIGGSNHKRIEEKAHLPDEKYQRILDNMLEGCQIIGYDWRYLYVNDAVARHGRRDKEELLGQTMMEMYPGIEDTAMFAVLRQCMENRTAHRMENEFSFPDGSKGWFELSIQPVPEGIFILSLDITEKKRVDEALRQSEEKFSKTFHASPEAAAITRIKDNRFIEVNDAFIRATGYTREEVLNDCSVEPGMWAKAEDRRRILRLLKDEGRVYNEEASFRIKSGEIRTVLFSAETINIGGEPCHISMGIDITERKRAEDALRETTEKYKRLFDSSPFGITTLDLNGIITSCNPAVYRLWGYSEEDLVGKHFTTIAPLQIEDIPKYVKIFQSVLKGEIPEPFETSFKRKDGTTGWTEVHVNLLKADGKMLGIQAIQRDITEQKRAEEMLRVSEQQYKKLFRNISEPVMVINQQGRIVNCSEAMLKLLGYRRQEFLKLTPADIVHPDFKPRIKTIRDRIWNEKTIRLETAYRSKDGKRVPADIIACVIEYKGSPAVLTMVHKITGQESMEGSYAAPPRATPKKYKTPLLEKFIREGFRDLSERAGVRLIFNLCQHKPECKENIRKHIKDFYNIRLLLSASDKELKNSGVCPRGLFTIKLLRELPAEVLKQRIIERSVYKSPGEIFDYLYYSMRDLKREVFKVIYLNNRSQIIDVVTLFEGALDSVNVHAREVVESAISHGAAGLVFVHNHPSGDPTPSRSDKYLTRDLTFVGLILQTKVLDHIIIGDNRYFSFADEGLIQKYEDNFLNLRIKGVLTSRQLYRNPKHVP